MKKIFLSLFFTVALMSISNAQTDSSKVAADKWPYGCRTWTVGINVGFFSMTSEVTLCCVAANWKNPPISCIEMRTSNSNYYQYIMIDEIEKISDKKIEVNSITVWSDKPILENGESYNLVRNEYIIEKNEKNERFIKVTFQKQIK